MLDAADDGHASTDAKPRPAQLGDEAHRGSTEATSERRTNRRSRCRSLARACRRCRTTSRHGCASAGSLSTAKEYRTTRPAYCVGGERICCTCLSRASGAERCLTDTDAAEQRSVLRSERSRSRETDTRECCEQRC